MTLGGTDTFYISPKGNFVTFCSRRYAVTSKTSSFYGKLSYLNFINFLPELTVSECGLSCLCVKFSLPFAF